MNTMHDALKSLKDQMEEVKVVLADTQTVNGEMLISATEPSRVCIERIPVGTAVVPSRVCTAVVPSRVCTAVEQSASSVPAPVERIPVGMANVQDEDGFADIIRGRIMARLQEFVAGRDSRDAGLQERRERLAKNETNLRDLYRQRSQLEEVVQEENLKLSEAKKDRFITQGDVFMLQAGVDEFTQYLINTKMQISALESECPEVKAKLDEERRLVVVRQRFLKRFAKEMNETGIRYLAKGTPTPSVGNVKEADAFLLKSIKEANDLEIVIPAAVGGTAIFVAHNGSQWNPAHTEITEEVEICKELDMYEQAIHAADQKKLQEWADKDADAGLLLIPSQVAEEKKSPHNRHSLLDMVRLGDGFCFVPIESKKSADLFSYHAVRPEMKVEYDDSHQEGNKKHTLRVTSVTAPHFVEDFFFPKVSGGKRVTPTFHFNDLHEIATWGRTVIRDSLTKGIRRAEGWEKEASVMKKLSDVSRVSNLKTLDQMSMNDGASGTAVIRVPKSGYANFDIGFEMVSDGVTVLPGPLATDRSRKLPIYEEIIDGKPVAEFFARAKDGSFVNERLQGLAVRNEAFELSWLMPAAAAEYVADYVSVDNVASLVMLPNEGGRNGTYVFKVSVREESKGSPQGYALYRDVAYVIRREDDKLTFVAALTRYSVDRFREQGFALNTPYGLGELRGLVLHILQIAYSNALDVPYHAFPEHLKGARSKVAQGGATHAADKGEGLVPREEDRPDKIYNASAE